MDTALYSRRHNPCHVWTATRLVRHLNTNLDRTGAVRSRRALGGPALLRQGMAIGRQPQPEYVDVDRPGHRRGLRL